VQPPISATFADASDLVRTFLPMSTTISVCIDQPTIVPNETGMRPVEKTVARLISFAGGGVQPSNRGKQDMFGDGASIWTFRDSFGFNLDPAKKASHLSLIEVYPSLALLAFNSDFLARKAGPKYNPANKSKFTLEHWKAVCDTASEIAKSLAVDGASNVLTALRGLDAPRKRDQDRLDALLCALVGVYWHRRPDECRVFGDVETGLILTPESPKMAEYFNGLDAPRQMRKPAEPLGEMKLSGVKVLDLSAFLPGPHMTMMLSDHGADVVMVEPDNGVGEPTRHMGERYPDGNSVWFSNISRGKKSYSVNLKDAEQHAAFMKLVAEADVFVEAFRPGVVKRLGVDYDAVKAVNPGIIYCSISAFGQDGVYRDKPAHDLVVQAMAGTADLTRGMDESPALTPMPSADMAASLHALSGILMALYRRTQTETGDYLDISMYDSLLSWVPNVTGAVFAEDRLPKRSEMRSFGGNAFVNIYETQDGGHIVLGGSEPKFVKNVLTAFNAMNLIESMKKPVGQQEDVKNFLRAKFKTKPQSEWEAIFVNIECCWSTIRSLHAAFTDAAAPKTIDANGKTHINNPIRFKNEPAQLSFDLPEIGEDTEALNADGLKGRKI